MEEIVLVKTLSDLDMARNNKYVDAQCHKCHKIFRSIIPNAQNILNHGCIFCAEPKWEPVILSVSDDGSERTMTLNQFVQYLRQKTQQIERPK